MPSTTENGPGTVRLRPTREDALVARLAALAIAIHLVEAALPSPLPGVKPGLANVVTLVALFRYGLRVAVWVSLLRVLVASLLLGTFLSPAFALALAGALAAIAALALGRLVPGLGPVGYSVLAAMSHIAGQFAVAYAVLVPHAGLLHLLPPLASAALIFGLVSGIIAAFVLQRMARPVAETVARRRPAAAVGNYPA